MGTQLGARYSFAACFSAGSSAIDLETGATRMIEATTIDALSSIALLIAITLLYPTKRRKWQGRIELRLLFLRAVHGQ